MGMDGGNGNARCKEGAFEDPRQWGMRGVTGDDWGRLGEGGEPDWEEQAGQGLNGD